MDGVRSKKLELVPHALQDCSARRATANTGATKADVIQAFLQVAIYAGVPGANHAIKLAKQTYADMEAET